MLFFGSSAQALTLVCDLTNYNNSPHYNAKTIESWLPKRQTHVIDLKNNKARYVEAGFEGDITFSSNGRFQWHYIETVKNTNGTVFDNIYFKYVFLRKKKILKPSVEITIVYKPIDGVYGNCKETKVSKEDLKVLNAKPKTVKGKTNPFEGDI